MTRLMNKMHKHKASKKSSCTTCFALWVKENKKPDMDKPFAITSVARADLEGVGYDTSEVEDGTMQELADKMSEAYTNEVFWIDLEIIADYLKIPKKK